VQVLLRRAVAGIRVAGPDVEGLQRAGHTGHLVDEIGGAQPAGHGHVPRGREAAVQQYDAWVAQFADGSRRLYQEPPVIAAAGCTAPLHVQVRLVTDLYVQRVPVPPRQPGDDTLERLGVAIVGLWLAPVAAVELGGQAHYRHQPQVIAALDKVLPAPLWPTGTGVDVIEELLHIGARPSHLMHFL